MIGGPLITQDERQEYRTLLQEMRTLIDYLEGVLVEGKAVNPTAGECLIRMTGTTEPDAQLRALRFLYQKTSSQYDEHLRYAGQFRLSPFCEYMYRDEPPAKHHEFLIDYMERVHNGEIMRLAISMPPGAAKSSYSSIRFAAWHLGRRPDDRWLQGAHTQKFAENRLGKQVRALINEPRYVDVFPNMSLSAASAAADYFEFTAGRGYYKAVGVGTGISGYRCEIAGIDDPLASRKDAESEATRRDLHNWYESDFCTRGSNPKVPIFLVTTRWHEDDLVGHELHKMSEGKGDHWEVINVPALAVEGDPIGRKPGEGLWPEVFGTAYYEKVRRNSTGRMWNALYQGEPTDEEGGVLKREDVKRYQNVPEDEVRNGRLIKKIVKRVTLSVDAAEKATQRSDYTAATVWIETRDRKHYLVHAVRCKKEFVELTQWIDELARVWNVNTIIVEDRGAGTQYIQVRKTHPGPAPVIAIQTKQQSKEFRFDGVTPMFAAGEVFLPETGYDWIADLEAELFAFPNGRYDDYVDSVSQYLAWTREHNYRRGMARINTAHV